MEIAEEMSGCNSVLYHKKLLFLKCIEIMGHPKRKLYRNELDGGSMNLAYISLPSINQWKDFMYQNNIQKIVPMNKIKSQIFY